MSESKAYLGDGVYADVEFFGMGPCIILTTEDGICATNRIVLEPEVLQSLERYLVTVEHRLEQMKQAAAAEAEESDG